MDGDAGTTDWLSSKLSSSGQRPRASEVAEDLRLLRTQLPIPSIADIASLSQWTTKESDARHDLYHVILRSRDAHLRALFIAVSSAAHALRFTCNSPPMNDELAFEAQSESAPGGHFVNRAVRRENRDGDAWTLDAAVFWNHTTRELELTGASFFRRLN